jgi:TIGR03009 family protein
MRLTGLCLALGTATLGWTQGPVVSGTKGKTPVKTVSAPPVIRPTSGPANPAAPQGAGQANPRPQGQPLRVEAPDPKLLAILKKWEVESAKIQVLQGEHERTELNQVFSVEKRSRGLFYYEAPDKGRFDIQAIAFEPGQKSEIIDKTTQQPYQLATGSDQGWICTGAEILILTPKEKQYEVYPIPTEMRGQNIINSPLPFLFGMKATEAQRRFALKLDAETDSVYVILAVPRTELDSQNYKSAKIALSKQTFIPAGVMLIDPAGTVLTKYVFKNVKVNPTRNAIAQALSIFKDPDPFKPKLSGWKRIQAPEVVPVNGEAPAGNRPVEPLPQKPGFRLPLPGGR